MQEKENAQHWAKLLAYVQEQAHKGPWALAFSGGLDSRFLAHALQRAGCDVILYHATGVHIPASESAYAAQWAQQRGLRVQFFPVDVCQLEHVRNNSEKRCYYCKKHLLELFTQAAHAEGRMVCDGTNADDTQAHRPGLVALRELGILSPLAVCGYTKAMVRSVAVQTQLEYAEQKASPCLLTRLHYGMQVHADVLQNIAAAEADLHAAGVAQCRLRLRPEPLLQLTPHHLPEQHISNLLAKRGFMQVELLQEQNLSGYFDRK